MLCGAAELVADYQRLCYHMIMVPVKYNLEVIDNKTFERCALKGLNVQGEDKVRAPTKSGQAGDSTSRVRVGGMGGVWFRQAKKRLAKSSPPTGSGHAGSSATKGRKLGPRSVDRYCRFQQIQETKRESVVFARNLMPMNDAGRASPVLFGQPRPFINPAQ